MTLKTKVLPSLRRLLIIDPCNRPSVQLCHLIQLNEGRITGVNFGWSDNDLIKENWFSCPACTKLLERYLMYIQGQVINICGCQRLMTQLPFLMFSNFSFGDMYTNLKDICCDASKIPTCEAKNLIYRARGTVGSQKGKYHPPSPLPGTKMHQRKKNLRSFLSDFGSF